jgi:hypothetical protein
LDRGDRRDVAEPPTEEFGELLRYTGAGYVLGLGVAVVADGVGWQRSGWWQWIVRTVTGEGESLFEGAFAIRRRMVGGPGSLAEAYGWGKIAGLCVPWIIDGASRVAGVNVNGLEGFYIPYFYAMTDQLGANAAGLVFFRRREGRWTRAVARYLTHPVMLSGLALLAAVPAGLFVARWWGFTPDTQVRTALETMLANLCWVPPAVGWLAERRRTQRDRRGSG